MMRASTTLGSSLFLAVSLAGCPAGHDADAGADAPLGLDAATDTPEAIDAPTLPDTSVRPDAGEPIDAMTDVPAARDAGTDAPVPTDVGPLDGDAFAFVMTTGDLPEVNARDEAPGFDLDGLPGTGATARCDDEIDYTSVVTGAPNVDNQFSANVAGLLRDMFVGGFRGEVETSLAAGDGLIGIVVEGVDSFSDDPLVVVHAYELVTASGSAPLVGTDGRITAGQSFRVTGDLGFRVGAIVSGRLDGGFDRLPLPGSLTLPFEAIRMGAAISATGLTAGELGGQVSVAAIVELVTSLGLGVSEDTIRAIARPDLMADATGDRCEAISIGMDFEAVAATIE